MRKLFRDIRLYYWRKVRETSRNPVFIFMGLSIPFLYLLLFSPMLKNFKGMPGFETSEPIDVFVPGMLVMMAFLNGLFAGWVVIDELRSGVIERFRVTPSGRFAILAGPVLRDLCETLLQSLLFVLIAIPFGFHIDIPGLIVLFILLALVLAMTSSFVNALALIVKSEEKLAPIVHGINLPIFLLSGVLLPMSLAPKWLQTTAWFNPLYHVIQAARQLALGEIATAKVAYAFAIMTLLVLLVMTWATRVFRRAVS